MLEVAQQLPILLRLGHQTDSYQQDSSSPRGKQDRLLEVARAGHRAYEERCVAASLLAQNSDLDIACQIKKRCPDPTGRRGARAYKRGCRAPSDADL